MNNLEFTNLGNKGSQILAGFSDDLEKGGKPATIGEIRVWSGVQYQRTADGWEEVKEGMNNTSQQSNQNKRNPKTKEDQTSQEGGSTVENHASSTPTEYLKKFIASSKDDKLVAIAKAELEKRGQLDSNLHEDDKKSLENHAKGKVNPFQGDDDKKDKSSSNKGKEIDTSINGKPIYKNSKDPHQFMDIYSRNNNHGILSKSVVKALKKLSDEDLEKFKKHHEKYGRHYLNHSKESELRREKDEKQNPKNESGYTDQSHDDASHYEAQKAAEAEIQRRKDGGAQDRELKNANRRVSGV